MSATFVSGCPVITFLLRYHNAVRLKFTLRVWSPCVSVFSECIQCKKGFVNRIAHTLKTRRRAMLMCSQLMLASQATSLQMGFSVVPTLPSNIRSSVLPERFANLTMPWPSSSWHRGTESMSMLIGNVPIHTTLMKAVASLCALQIRAPGHFSFRDEKEHTQTLRYQRALCDRIADFVDSQTRMRRCSARSVASKIN